MFMNGTLMVYDFDINSDLNSWQVVDDNVMGGISKGTFYINEQGNAVFRGKVSLENNGGFSSIRFNSPPTKVAEYSSIVFRIRGDNKPYQLRIKSNSRDRISYVTYFETTGEWDTIEIQLSDMYPSFRGRKLDMPNYDGELMNELAFLIGNKKVEFFQLEIDWIKLK